MILTGDVIPMLRTLPSSSVQCCVTSPPYWGLRDYGVPGQIGLETTFDEFLAKLVGVFAEVHRVLKADGTLWINMGDSYNSGSRPKDLIGQPWRLAFALQDTGWYLRQDIIWHKPNAMPESVRDRCTKAHEYLFLLSKSRRYYWNFDAMQEPTSGTAKPRGKGTNPKAMKTPDGWDTSRGRGHGTIHAEGREKGKTPGKNSRIHTSPQSRQNKSFSAAVRGLVETRNKRSVWTVPTHPYKEAHFATFPPALIEPCILVGSRPGDTILDPFGGSGTTGQVAAAHGRDFILIELNPQSVALAEDRVSQPLKPRKSAAPRRAPVIPLQTEFNLA